MSDVPDPTAEDRDDHLAFVADALLEGDVVPILGAGANLCDRPPHFTWTPGDGLPDGSELAKWLCEELHCDVTNPSDLLRVSQYADLTRGSGPLYRHLRVMFARDDYPIPSLHRFLARLPSRSAQPGRSGRHLLIVTTNYDNLLERALQEAGEPHDVLRYLTLGPGKGHFVHEASDDAGRRRTDRGARCVITNPRKYKGLALDERTVVLKFHGGFDARGPKDDSFVITEDDYIDYLARTSPNDLIPSTVLEKLLNSHFLFLGYGLRDWNLRVVLHRLWGQQDLTYESWAVQRAFDDLDEKMWARQHVELRKHELSEYMARLAECVKAALGDAAPKGRHELGGVVG